MALVVLALTPKSLPNRRVVTVYDIVRAVPLMMADGGAATVVATPLLPPSALVCARPGGGGQRAASMHYHQYLCPPHRRSACPRHPLSVRDLLHRDSCRVGPVSSRTLTRTTPSGRRSAGAHTGTQNRLAPGRRGVSWGGGGS